MNNANALLILTLLIASCRPGGDTSNNRTQDSGSTTSETEGEDSATVQGTVQEQDSAKFTNEIDVNNWETFDSQNTTGVNLSSKFNLITQEEPLVEIFRLGDDPNGEPDFLPEKTVALSPQKTFEFRVKAMTYYVVKYKTLSAMVPALAKDTVLPLVLNEQSSIAVNLFIRMMQSPEGKTIAGSGKVNNTLLESLSDIIAKAGTSTDTLSTILNSVLQPVIVTLSQTETNGQTSGAETLQKVEAIINQAISSGTLSTKTQDDLKQSVETAKKQDSNPGNDPASPQPSPADPANAGASTVTAQSLTLSWTPPASGATGFAIAYAAGDQAPADCKSGTQIVSTAITGSSHLVTGLSPATKYSFRICSINSDGQASKGTIVIATTRQATPPNPGSFAVTATTPNSLTLTWSSGGGSTASYVMSYSPGTTPPESCTTGTAASPSAMTETVLVVTGLLPSAPYSFRLCAKNADAQPDTSTGVTVTGTTANLPEDIHLAYIFGGKLRHLKGTFGNWTDTEVATVGTKPGTDWQNISMSFWGNEQPMIGLFSNNQSGGDGHATMYRKSGDSWLTKTIVASHSFANTSNFIDARQASTGLTQLTMASVTSYPRSDVYYFDVTSTDPPAGTQIPTQLNASSWGNRPLSCVDDHDRHWIAKGSSATGTSEIYFSYRTGGNDPSASISLVNFSTDPCQGEIDAFEHDGTYLLDIDCRHGKLTFLTACYGSGGYASTLWTSELNISASGAPNLLGAVTPVKIRDISSFEVTGGFVTRTSSGALRVAYMDPDSATVHYYDGSTWASAISGLDSTRYFAFTLDRNDTPHFFYVTTTGNDRLNHTKRTGTTNETETLALTVGTGMIFTREPVAHGVKGKSNK